MDKLQLEYFISVAKTQNISKSADALFVSQSSLSQTIKRLEQEIGYPLFNRHGKHISLNQNGYIFYDAALKIKKIYEDAINEIDEYNDKKNHEIKIHMCCASHYLPQLLTYLQQNLSNTQFFITQQPSNIHSCNESDISIIATLEPLQGTNISLLMKENILLAVPQGHKLYDSKAIFTTDLIYENFISLNSTWSLEQAIKNKCEQNNINLKTSIQVGNPDILRRLLNEKLGLAFVPEKTWGTALCNKTIHLHKVSDFQLSRYIYLTWSEGFIRSNVKQCLSLIQHFFNNDIT